MPVIEDPTIAAAAGGGTPSEIYLLFILGLCKEYFKATIGLDPKAIDAATAALVAFVPSRPTRQRLWAEYIQKKEECREQGGSAALSASVYTVGECVSELSVLLEFTQESHGSIL